MTLLGDKNIYEEEELREEYEVPSIYQADAEEELPLRSCVFISALLHPTVAGLAWLVVFLLALVGINLELFHKPAQPPKDIEFVLVNKEAEPINKNTPYRADMNSRAGGIHDPKRPVSMPSPSSAPAKQQQKAAPAKQTPKKQQAQQPKKQPVQQKPQFKMPWDNKPVQKPSPAPAPKATTPKASTPAPRPALKPTSPKPTAKPQGNFNIPIPKTSAPKLAGTPGGPVTASKSGSSSKSGSGVGAPSPSFAPRGTSGGRFSSSGSSGSRGNVGNPGPGNPKGAPGIDAVKEPDFGPYMRELQRRIKMNWEPPKGNESKRVVLLFRIGRDGRLLSNKVLKSSGLAVADNAAKAAVELTAPFKPLPPEYKGSSVDIQFTFDYNVFGATSYY